MPTETARTPWPVLVAVGILAVESLAVLAFSTWLFVRRMHDTPSNERVFEGAVVYLLIFALLIGLVALALRSLRGWAYGAAVVVQLISLGVTYEMASAGFWLGALLVGLSAVAALGGLLLSRPSRSAFGRDVT